MDISDILGSVSTSGGKKKTKAKRQVNEEVQQFVALLGRVRLRISYAGATALARGPGGVENVLPFASPSCYPAEFQPMIARDNGSYHENAPSKWGEDAPAVEDLTQLRILSEADKVIGLFNAWKENPERVEAALSA